MVKDEGVGIHQENYKDVKQHVEIENFRNRISKQCTGSFRMETKKGVGTTVVITIPKYL